MKKYIFIETTFFEGDAPGIFEFIITDHQGNATQSGKILMHPNIDFDDLKSSVIYTEDGQAHDFGLDDDTIEKIKEDYRQIPNWNCPTFSEYYQKIKAIVDGPDSIVVGLSATIDQKMLNAACQKENLVPFDFEGHDLSKVVRQMVHNTIKNNADCEGIDLMCAVEVVKQLCEVQNNFVENYID